MYFYSISYNNLILGFFLFWLRNQNLCLNWNILVLFSFPSVQNLNDSFCSLDNLLSGIWPIDNISEIFQSKAFYDIFDRFILHYIVTVVGIYRYVRSVIVHFSMISLSLRKNIEHIHVLVIHQLAISCVFITAEISSAYT